MNVKQWLSVAGVVTALLIAGVTVSRDQSRPALAHEDPADCAQQASRSGASLQVYFDNNNDGVPDSAVGSQPVVAGDRLLYEAGVNIGGQLPASCTAFDIHVWLKLPGAAGYVKACEVAVLTAGDEIFCTEAGATPEAAFPTGMVPYTVNLAHINGAGRLPSDTTSRGDVHDSAGDCLLTDAEKNANNPDPGQCFRAAASRSLAHANPQLGIAKACVSPQVFVGQNVNFNVALTNNSTSTTGVRVEINSISVTDSLTGTLAPPGPFTLNQSGASTTPVFTHTTAPPAGTVENTASASSASVTLYSAANAVLRILPGVSAGPASSNPDCTTVKRPPVIVTTSNPTGQITPGTAVSDSAAVSGSGPIPTGTVDFILCQPAEATGAGCPSPNGTIVGNDVALDAAGNASSPSTTNTTAIGKYCWRVEYSGDAFYLPGSHTNADSECFTTVANPAISIVKTAGNAADGVVLQIQPGASVVFHYRVCNTGDVPLSNVTVTDDNATPGAPGDDFTVNVPGPIPATNPDTCVNVDSNPITISNPPVCSSTRVNIAEAAGTAPDGTVVKDTDPAALCTPKVKVVCQGCLPLFWATHTSAWTPTGYTPDMKVEAAFGVTLPNGYHDVTLLQALNLSGNQINGLLRHGVAALLNASHPQINFGMSKVGVIQLFRSGVNAGGGNPASSRYQMFTYTFAVHNDDGCPLPQ